MYHFSSLLELAYSRIASISVEDIYSFASKCGWVGENESALFLTHRGSHLLRLHEQGLLRDMQRQMLMDYILNITPAWSNLIPRGRSEATIFMTKDEKACFFEAGLLSDRLDHSTVDWWDTIASRIRADAQQGKTEIGRMGERYTIEYERKRTDSEPIWMAVDSNLLGYDVKSRQKKDDPATLLIEVKASTFALRQACLHITAHEWNVATTSAAYMFHLWCLFGNKKLLAVVSPEEIQPYIPTQNLEGEWESVKIPFSCFENRFVEIV